MFLTPAVGQSLSLTGVASGSGIGPAFDLKSHFCPFGIVWAWVFQSRHIPSILFQNHLVDPLGQTTSVHRALGFKSYLINPAVKSMTKHVLDDAGTEVEL